jgi:hypothetical protein
MKARLSQQRNLYRAYDYVQYSNLGMSLLGEAVGTVSGQGFQPYVRNNIIGPLGLKGTTPDLPTELHGKELAIGYTARKGGWERRPFPPYRLNALAPAGGFASTAEDLAKFTSWQIRLLSRGGEEVLRSSTLREMQRVHWVTPDEPDERWGLGFSQFNDGGKTFVGHAGHCPGYRSIISMRPQEKIGLIVLTNVEDGNPGRFVSELYKLLGADIARAAKTAPPVAPAGPPAAGADLEEFEGLYEFPGWDRDYYVAPYGDELILIRPYVESLGRSLSRYRKVGPDTFRRVRADDSLAEEIRFDRGRDGRPNKLWWFSNYFTRK